MDACPIPLPSDPISLIISLVALGVSWFAILRANKGASASALIAINESFRNSWSRFLSAPDDTQRAHEFADLLNCVEAACAIDADGAFTGTSRELLREYLESILGIIYGNEFARSKMDELSQSPTTFKYIKKFKKRCDRKSLSFLKKIRSF